MRAEQADPDRGATATAAAGLSRFQGHCLYRRTRECEELLRLAVLGIEQVQTLYGGELDLARIAHHLCEAEHQVAIACGVAARWRP